MIPELQPVKRFIYVSGFTLLGLLVSIIVHVALELPLLRLVSSDPMAFADAWWWQRWDILRTLGSWLLLSAGAVWGYGAGRRYWKLIYIQKKRCRGYSGHRMKT